MWCCWRCWWWCRLCCRLQRHGLGGIVNKVLLEARSVFFGVTVCWPRCLFTSVTFLPVSAVCRPWVRDLRLGVRRALVETYSDGMFWWEAAMMAQRLVRPGLHGLLAAKHACDHNVTRGVAVGQVLGLVFSFGSAQPGVQALVLTLLCIVYGVLHATLVPMRSPVVGTL